LAGLSPVWPRTHGKEKRKDYDFEVSPRGPCVKDFLPSLLLRDGGTFWNLGPTGRQLSHWGILGCWYKDIGTLLLPLSLALFASQLL
jgi:hypothetical protein